MKPPDYPIPPYRELRPGRLAERRRHLLTAIALEPRSTVPARRVALLAGGGACAAAAVALALSLSGGSSKSNPRFLIHATHSPVWSVAHVNLGRPTCSVLAELAAGCRGTLAVPAPTQRQRQAWVACRSGH
jgi:hypothetical protein